MAGPQRIDAETETDVAPSAAAVLPSFDLDIAPLRPISQAAPSFGPLPRARARLPAPALSTAPPVAQPATPDTSPAGRALDALAALLAAPLGETVPAAAPAPAAQPQAKVIAAPQPLLDSRAELPQVGFASTELVFTAVPTVQPGTTEHPARSRLAVQRAAFEISDGLPDLLPHLQRQPAAQTVTPEQPQDLLADLPWGSVTYRLFVM